MWIETQKCQQVEMRQKYFLIGIFFFTLSCLQGCVNVATTSAQAIYNHHSIEKNLNDQYITMQAYKALSIDNDQFKNANISTATYNGEMLLVGQAPEAWQRTKAEEIVKKIEDVQHVYNLVTIANPSSTLTKISDTWITAKIKAKLIASGDVDGSQVKVVTENGTVYLMGILQPDEAQAAIDLASNTDGVGSVVKIFSYVSITKA